MNWDLTATYSIQILASIVCGGLIGIQRAIRGKVAGVRTHILICVGAALFTQLSLGFPPSPHPDATIRWADPARVAAQVVVGCGFIGAGAIIRTGLTVAGLTSAATIWVVAALGMAAGAGRYEILLPGTLAGMFALYVLGALPVTTLRSFNTMHVTFINQSVLARYKREFATLDSSYRLLGFHRATDGSITIDIMLRLPGPEFERLENTLLNDPEVTQIDRTPTL